MTQTTYEYQDVPGGSPVKMWTRGVPVDDKAREQLSRAAKMPFSRARRRSKGLRIRMLRIIHRPDRPTNRPVPPFQIVPWRGGDGYTGIRRRTIVMRRRRHASGGKGQRHDPR